MLVQYALPFFFLAVFWIFILCAVWALLKALRGIDKSLKEIALTLRKLDLKPDR
jgi:hypothetical protein